MSSIHTLFIDTRTDPPTRSPNVSVLQSGQENGSRNLLGSRLHDFSGFGLSSVRRGWLSVASSSLMSRATCMRKWWNMAVLTSKVRITPFVSVICTKIEGLNSRFMLEVIIVTSIRHLNWNKPVLESEKCQMMACISNGVVEVIIAVVPGCRILFRRFALSSCVSRLKGHDHT